MTNIVNQTEQRQVMLGRLAAGLVRSNIYPTLQEAYRAARLILLEAESITSITKLNAVTAQIRRAVAEIDAGGWSEVTKELEQIALYDAAYYAGLVGTAASVKLSTPPDEKIIGYINKSMMSLTQGQKVDAGTWAQFTKAFASSHTDTLDSIVRNGYAQGQTVAQMAAQMRQVTDGLLKVQAETLARTGVQHYAVNAREAMFLDNDVDEVVYNSTLDNRATTLCAGRDGKRWKMNDPKRPALPAHYNCLSEDTLVSTCSDVSNVYKRWYEGVMVNIATKSGRSIKITPNHPVLTSRGWVAAGDIDLLDKVITVEDVSAFAGENYKNCANARFGELFSALNVFVNPSFISVRPTTTEDFHGDRSNSDVEVINTSSFGGDGIWKSFFEEFKDGLFPPTAPVGFSFHSFSSGNLGGLCSDNAFASGMSSSSELGNFFGCRPSHSSELLLGAISGGDTLGLDESDHGAFTASKIEVLMDSVKTDSGLISGDDCLDLLVSELNNPPVLALDAVFLEQPMNDTDGESCSVGDFLERHGASFFHIDDVVGISLGHYSGHVYNLENKDNWYLSNGIVTHNCRSVYIPAIAMQDVETRAAVGGKEGREAAELFEEKQDRTGKKVKYKGRKDSEIFKAGQVQYTTYDKWLEKQPRWFVESALDKERAELFLSGKVSISQFNDLSGRPLTLAQLRALDGG
jgi:SPP1 gp7 family putative phage head morphogenesis protein